MSKSMTSGKKTPVGLKVVVDALKKWSSARTPSRSPDCVPLEKNSDKESSQRPMVVPTLPTSSASSSKRLSKAEAAKALGLTSVVEEIGVSCGLEAASVSPASVHGSSSEESCWLFSCGLLDCHLLGGLNQASFASQISRPCCPVG